MLSLLARNLIPLESESNTDLAIVAPEMREETRIVPFGDKRVLPKRDWKGMVSMPLANLRQKNRSRRLDRQRHSVRRHTADRYRDRYGIANRNTVRNHRVYLKKTN